MIGDLFKFIAGVASETVDGVKNTGEYIYDEIASIPDAVEKGWDEGLFSKEDETKPEEDAENEVQSRDSKES